MKQPPWETLVDGWLHTGDLREIDERGSLTVTGRKKELITSGGKSIAPTGIGITLRNSHFISEAVVVGDRRKDISALAQLPLFAGKWRHFRRVLDRKCA